MIEPSTSLSLTKDIARDNCIPTFPVNHNLILSQPSSSPTMTHLNSPNNVPKRIEMIDAFMVNKIGSNGIIKKMLQGINVLPSELAGNAEMGVSCTDCPKWDLENGKT